jgi:hypothetical protein
LTQGETSTVDATPRFNTSATSLAGTTQPIPAGSSAPLFSVEKFVTPVVSFFLFQKYEKIVLYYSDAAENSNSLGI